jgi:hypothetical protein
MDVPLQAAVVLFPPLRRSEARAIQRSVARGGTTSGGGGLCAQTRPEQVLTLIPGLCMNRDLLRRLLAHAHSKLIQMAGPHAPGTWQPVP